MVLLIPTHLLSESKTCQGCLAGLVRYIFFHDFWISNYYEYFCVVNLITNEYNNLCANLFYL